MEMMNKIKGTPKEPVPRPLYRRVPASSRRSAEPAAASGFIPQPAPTQPPIRNWKIYRRDVQEFGATEGCPGCWAVVRGLGTHAGHTEECRTRMHDLIKETDEGQGRLDRAAERATKQAATDIEEPRVTAPPQGGGEASSSTQPAAGPLQQFAPDDADWLPPPVTPVEAPEERPRRIQRGILPPPAIPVEPPEERQRRIQQQMHSRSAPEPPRSAKRKADEPTEDGSHAEGAAASTHGAGPPAPAPSAPATSRKRPADTEPDDPRIANHGEPAEVVHDAPASSLDSDHTCATCSKRFRSRNQLHRHLRRERHQVIDDHDSGPPGLVDSSDDECPRSEAARAKAAQQRRQAVLDHFARHDPDGSVTGSPPGTEDCRWPAAVHDQDSHGEAGQPKPYSPPEPGLCGIDSASMSQPGQRVKRADITDRDQRWIDIRSGLTSKVFIGAERLHTTYRGGPNVMDIQHRRVWSLTTGKMLDDCCIDDTHDDDRIDCYPFRTTSG